jgi:adenosylhomocysteine nucleosidase
VGGHGKTQLAVHTQHLIGQIQDLGAVICAGAAGALDRALKLGDLVVGTSTVEHDYRIRFVQRPLPRHDTNAQLLCELRVAADEPGLEFRVLFGASRAATRTSSSRREPASSARPPALSASRGKARG